MIRISLMIWRLPGECAATTTVADCSVLPPLWLIGYCRELCIHLVLQSRFCFPCGVNAILLFGKKFFRSVSAFFVQDILIC